MIAQLTGLVLVVALMAGACAILARLERPRPGARPAAPPAEPGEDWQLVELLPCLGRCAGRMPHEHAGDGSATCFGCGTPRTTDTDDEE